MMQLILTEANCIEHDNAAVNQWTVFAWRGWGADGLDLTTFQRPTLRPPRHWRSN